MIYEGLRAVCRHLPTKIVGVQIQLPELERITQCSYAVWRVLGENWGPETYQGTNSYIIGQGKSRILIDTSDDARENYIFHIRDTLRYDMDNALVSNVLLTHHHPDHVGALKEVMHVTGFIPTIHKHKRTNDQENMKNYFPFELNYFKDGDVFETEGATLKVVHTPGHTDDHCCFYLKEENALFTGDAVLGNGMTSFEDLKTHLDSLEKILQIKPARIYPGHGPWIDNCEETLHSIFEHRRLREEHLLQVIRSSKKPMNILQIARSLYKEVHRSQRNMAELNTLATLGKLCEEGKVNLTVEESKDGNINLFSINPDATSS